MANTNSLLTTDLIVREAVRSFTNELVLFKTVNQDHTKEFSKVNDTIGIRRPVYYQAAAGAVMTVGQDSIEGKTVLTLDKQFHVPMAFTSKDLQLSIEDFSKRYLSEAMAELVQKVENEIASKYTQIFNFTGTPGTPPSTSADASNVTDLFDDLGVPDANMRYMHYEPKVHSALANDLKVVFPNTIAASAIEKGTINTLQNLKLSRTASLPVHTVGNYGGVSLVNGAAQNTTYLLTKDTNTQTLVTDGWNVGVAGLLLAGDVITIAGVNSVNRRTRKDTGSLQTFVVINDVTSDGVGNATLTISPPMITTGAYQTVTAAPADNAAITVKTGTANASYRQNLGWHPNAMTIAVAPLAAEQIEGAKASVSSMDGISLRYVQQYDIKSDEMVHRIDILFGVAVQNPGFAARQTS